MTYGVINPNPEQRRAWLRRTWSSIVQQFDRFRALYSGNTLAEQRLRQRVSFTDQALATLGALNDFEICRILDDIVALTYNPKPTGYRSYWRNPFLRFIKSRYPFPRYHFLIEYEAQPNGHIAVQEIFLDTDLSGPKTPHSQERNMLYNVKRDNGMRYDRPMAKEEIVKLEGAWEIGDPVLQVTTRHAAVNGMLNELGKAAWLMGVHLDAAYRTANPEEYTLFHNPSEGGFADVVECMWDKPAINGSHNANHLAAVLRQRQLSGQITEWVVHSQGAIIFNAAVVQHNMRHGTPLNKHRAAVHGSGANLARLRANLRTAQIELVHGRGNPFDTVPNVFGANRLGFSSLVRSLASFGLVVSDNGGNVGISPHTLPYLGIRTYQRQLELAGRMTEFKRVQRYIAQRDRLRHARRLGSKA